jgi:ATP-binding cassette subfamily B protein
MQEESFHGKWNLSIWKKLFAYAGEYRKFYVLLAVSAACLAGLDASFTLITRELIDEVQVRGADVPLDRYAALYFVAAVVFSGLVALFIRVAGWISTGVSTDIRQRAFEHLQDLSFSFYDRRPSGWLMSRLTSDCDRLSRTLAWGVMDITWGSLFILIVSSVMLAVNWRLGLLVLTVLPMMIGVSLYFQPKILNAARAIRKQNSSLTALYNEGISGVETTKTLVREEQNVREFSRETDAMYRESMRSAILQAFYFPALMGLSGLGAAITIWAGGYGFLGGWVSPGDLYLFMSFSAMLFFPILEMAPVFAELQNTQASAERLLGLIDTVPDVRDTDAVRAKLAEWRSKPRAPGVALDGGRETIDVIEFRNVSFEYDPGQPVLQDFNLTVEPGQSVALVGPTGGGKTTIISLLCRFYEPTAGGIYFDGVEYRDRSLHWLQSNLGIVLQTPHLSSGTIRENIRYGRLDATDEEVEAAAALVRAHDFIVRLEHRYDTEVGEGGGNLSTGQKQLISFARAVLANPQIFVMDEATSSVDTETEKLIQDAMGRILHNRKSFVIAHRLSTIRSASTILVIDDGRIVEQGTHHDLIRRRGAYYELYTNQFTEEKSADLLR